MNIKNKTNKIKYDAVLIEIIYLKLNNKLNNNFLISIKVVKHLNNYFKPKK